MPKDLCIYTADCCKLDRDTCGMTGLSALVISKHAKSLKQLGSQCNEVSLLCRAQCSLVTTPQVKFSTVLIQMLKTSELSRCMNIVSVKDVNGCLVTSSQVMVKESKTEFGGNWAKVVQSSSYLDNPACI